MFSKMLNTLKVKMDNGNGGYEWNCDAEDFYNAMREMALADIITRKQWDTVNDFVFKATVK